MIGITNDCQGTRFNCNEAGCRTENAVQRVLGLIQRQQRGAAAAIY